MIISKKKINKYNLKRHCFINSLIDKNLYKNILIIGTGTGFQEYLLESYYNNIKCTSVDIIRYKNFIKDLEKSNNISFIIGDINNLNFNNNQFDLVICTEVLEHISLDILDNVIKKLYKIGKNHIFSVPFMEKHYLYNEIKSSCHKKSWFLEDLKTHFVKPNIKLLQSDIDNYWAFILNIKY
jgi:ubiquinone/menaquinone biosynthesis C-methylase UbiE